MIDAQCQWTIDAHCHPWMTDAPCLGPWILTTAWVVGHHPLWAWQDAHHHPWKDVRPWAMIDVKICTGVDQSVIHTVLLEEPWTDSQQLGNEAHQGASAAHQCPETQYHLDASKTAWKSISSSVIGCFK